MSVLFCDIVRSPELAAQAGPEEYHRVVDRFFALALAEVHRYEGTVNQFLGDGFMFTPARRVDLLVGSPKSRAWSKSEPG